MRDETDKRIWAIVCRSLQSDLGESVANSWIKPLSFDRIDNEMVFLGAPSMFMRDWVQNNYAERILHHFRKENPGIKSVEIVVSDENAPVSATYKYEMRLVQEEDSEDYTTHVEPLNNAPGNDMVNRNHYGRAVSRIFHAMSSRIRMMEGPIFIRTR